jgi:phospholipid/cholesterol/gamma-HCH transport system ATP-binding protein
VELRNVTFGYGERVILRDLSLQVPRGKVTALMGASGGGKTTVLRLIGGQQHAQQGQVLFDGKDVTIMDAAGLYAARRRMGMLFQFGALFTDMSVFDNVAFPLREHTDLPDELVRDIVLMKLHAVGLRGARDLMPSEISGGMARRVALARAIALDPELTGEVLRTMRELAQEHMTMLVVTHEMGFAREVANRVIFMDKGEIVEQGPAEAFFAAPQHARTQAFLQNML